jgi:NADPH:quinone reductase-like Zn-dependent oxidoreductase
MSETMQAIRLHPAPSGSEPYSVSNPAPPSALHLDTIDIPKPTAPGEVLVKIKASTIVRDALTWPETYAHEYLTMGNDLSGIVVEVYPSEDPDPNSNPNSSSKFKVGDEVFGMTAADRPRTWAQYAVVRESEIALRPKSLTWEEAAALPLSGQTALEALFVRAGVAVPSDVANIRENKGRDSPKADSKKVLITGAAGGVGVYIVQLARFAGLHVTAATSSNARNEDFLRSLGAHDCIEYATIKGQRDVYDLVIDCVGGEPLIDAWKAVKGDGKLITVDSSSYNFLEDHRKRGIARGGVEAFFFIVEGRSESLEALARFADLGILEVFVLKIYPLARAKEAYEYGNGRFTGRGKVVLSI